MAELTGVPTPQMDWSAVNLPEQWKKFHSHAELIFNGPLKAKSEDVKVTYLLLWVGDKGREVRNSWTDLDADEPPEDPKKLKTLYDRYKAHVQPKLNPIFARFKFNNEIQGSSTVEQFITRLRLLAVDCTFKDPEDMIRDRIVFGTSSDKVREKLINEGEKLTLDKAIQIAQSYEYSQQQLKSMGSQLDQVNSIRKASTSRHPVKKRTDPGSHPGPDGARRRRNRNYRPQNQNGHPECDQCGYKHSRAEKCPAQGKICKNCKGYNHFAKKCRFKKVDDIQIEPESQYVDSESEFFIDSIDSCTGSKTKSVDQAFCNISVGPSLSNVRFKLDTGSQANILPRHVFESIGQVHDLDTDKAKGQKLLGYNDSTIHTLGCIDLACQYKDRSLNVMFHVVDTNSSPILGMKACMELNLIQLVYSCDVATETTPSTPQVSKQQAPQPLDKQQILGEYRDVFEGIGLFPGECTIRTDPDVPPVVHPPRRVPLALQDKLKAELERMEKLDVICKVTEPTEWVNSLVIVEKPETGKIRVCLDPKDLNKAILRPHYPPRALEDVLPKLAGAQYFTKLDARSGYWTIKLSNDSSLLTTFNTPFGRYRYLRLPFGLKSSQDEFQRRVDECFEGLDGVIALVDDIIVHGKTRQEHDENLRRALLRSRERGLKLNRDKLEVGVTKVKYFGHTLTAKGLEPDPDKVSAIHAMKPPTNKSELETLLGMVTYLAKFAPNLSEITSPLRSLLTKDVLFVWDKEQQESFQKVKEVITSTPGPVLSYFDPQKVTTLQVDASKYGLGATIMQGGKPIAFASKSLNPTEVNYAQIEKEMYGIVFGCKRFHQYIYGRKIVVETDHKPLIPIFKKPLYAAPPRLQRMLLQLQRYDLDVTFKPGSQIPVADTLSRNFVQDTFPEFAKGMNAHVHTILSSIPISDCKLEEVRRETELDEQLQLLRDTILDGWPDARNSCPPKIVDFWNHRDELSYIDGLLLKGSKIVIPRSLRTKILESIHTGHMGIEKCLKRARSAVFWPGMTNDITELVSKCSVCITYRNSNPKEPLQPYPTPDYPWQTVATDLFTWDDKDFIVVTDYYSRYFEVTQLRGTTSAHVIHKLKGIFSRFGIPENVVSDNGPQYSSQEFAHFAQSYDFNHITSSPRYPKSNGLAEKFVQIVKRIFEKAKVDNRDPYLAMLEYRVTPLDIGYSPAQLLQGRQFRSVLPTTAQQMLPQYTSTNKVKDLITKSHDNQKKFHDQGSKPAPPIKEGEYVRFQKDDKAWKPAIILDELDHNSYLVKSADGKVYRRNRRHILKTQEPNHTLDTSLPLCTKPFVSLSKSKDLKILSDEKITSQKNPIVSSPESQKSFEPPISTSEPYVTRSGRVCKPKVIKSM